MAPISIVIITKNEAKNIEACIRSAQTVSDDVVVVDCGSEDETTALASRNGARVIAINWQCYGHSRNTGASAARHDWILSLDADERVSPALAAYLTSASFEKNTVYKIKRENYFAGKKLQFGTPGYESVVRLYHRSAAQWDLVPVHEKLQTTASRKIISQPILHFGISNLQEHQQKKDLYAWLSAQKYFQQQKKASLVKRYLAPPFDAAKSYVFQLGFLDGRKGWQVATAILHYTWLKYNYLHQLTKKTITEKEYLMAAPKKYAGLLSLFFAKR